MVVVVRISVSIPWFAWLLSIAVAADSSVARVGTEQQDPKTRDTARADQPIPAPRHRHASAYDRKRIVLFGGSDSNHKLYRDTWEWDGERWKQISNKGPAARTVPAMAYDSTRGVVVL